MELPHHIHSRMYRRGVTAEEIEQTIEFGWPGADARNGVESRTLVFEFNAVWERRWYPEKEVTVYFKYDGSELILVTLKTRYGSDFPRGSENEG